MTKRVCAGPCGKRRDEKSFTSPRGRVCKLCQRTARRRAAKDRRLRLTYGISLEEYETLLEAQGGVCAACKQQRTYELHVDHDHALERLLLSQGFNPQLAARLSIRGLVCKRDNKVLRDVRDSVEVLRGLSTYLLNPPAQAVLDSEGKAA